MINTVIQSDVNGVILSIFQVESTRDAYTWFQSARRYFQRRQGHVMGFFDAAEHGRITWRRTPQMDVFDGPVIDEFVW